MLLGSPPRVRGKVHPFVAEVRPFGITPACAGKSGLYRGCRSPGRDHPRVCGEKTMIPQEFGASLGSPPRVRGKGLLFTPPVLIFGITPACAGKSLRPTLSDWPAQGSPPRVRGKAFLQWCSRPGKGITPACAGKSCGCAAPAAARRDHPRVCGEKPNTRRVGHPGQGSPPRVRGKARKCRAYRSVFGITPACAGKRVKHEVSPGRERDHPRVCGEKFPWFCSSLMRAGSPPRVRGKEIDQSGYKMKYGITPACAGKSGPSSGCACTARDHPRVCGEKRFLSSVLMSSAWITPACAGKSPPSSPYRAASQDHPRVCGEKTKKIP